MAAKVLILGGTRDAYKLAERLHGKGIAVTTALAGVTHNPRRPAGALHIGSLGGAKGLAAFLQANGFTHLVDATHPYAAQISANAVAGAEEACVPLIRLNRPAWEPPPGANWREFDALENALGALPAGARVLATIGSKQLPTLLQWNAGRLVIRMLDRPAGDPPAHAEIIIGRPPFAERDEEALMRDRRITHLLTKNSGGSASWSKISAASKLGLGIFVLQRPALPLALQAHQAHQAIDLEAVEAFVHSPSS